MAERIVSDSGLSETQSRTLRVMLDAIIPADAGRRMPSAAELDLMGYVGEFAPEALDAIRVDLDAAEDLAQKRLGIAFGGLSADDAIDLVNTSRATQPRFAQTLITQALGCYYQDDRVVTALGYPAGPPFPQGNTVEKGDLSLLEPVRKMGKIYRG
jgi:hypothetical protein